MLEDAPQELAGQCLADALGAAGDHDTQRCRGRPPEAHHAIPVQRCMCARNTITEVRWQSAISRVDSIVTS